MRLVAIAVLPLVTLLGCGGAKTTSLAGPGGNIAAPAETLPTPARTLPTIAPVSVPPDFVAAFRRAGYAAGVLTDAEIVADGQQQCQQAAAFAQHSGQGSAAVSGALAHKLVEMQRFEVRRLCPQYLAAFNKLFPAVPTPTG